MSFNKTYDLAIVGGGPAGATAALYASRLGLKAILIDKSIWPRDKICGDALSGKAVDMLKDLDILKHFLTPKLKKLWLSKVRSIFLKTSGFTLMQTITNSQ